MQFPLLPSVSSVTPDEPLGVPQGTLRYPSAIFLSATFLQRPPGDLVVCALARPLLHKQRRPFHQGLAIT